MYAFLHSSVFVFGCKNLFHYFVGLQIVKEENNYNLRMESLKTSGQQRVIFEKLSYNKHFIYFFWNSWEERELQFGQDLVWR